MVYVCITDGFEEIEALAVVDILRRGNVAVATVSMTGHEIVRSVHGISVNADILFEQSSFENCRMIVLPGGLPGTEKLSNHAGLIMQIKSFHQDRKYIAAICAAPTILGEHNLLKGKKATVYPGMEDKLIGAMPSSDTVVVDGNIITSQGPGTAMEFGLVLLRLLKGSEIEAQVRHQVLLD